MRQLAALLLSMAVVSSAFAAPNVVVTSLPKGMVQTIGGAGASDSFTIANVGDASASLAFQPSGSFFTISASTILLAPGATQTISIQGVSQSAQGISAGAVIITGSGVPSAGIRVPVRLMAGPVPAGTVSALPQIGGLILYGLAGQHSGTISFHNNGNATMQGMAVGDTSWLVPQTGFVTAQPSQNGQASFTVDPTQRPDAIAPMGGTTGNLSLRFLNGNATAQSVSVSIVDVVSPTTTPGEPSPLAPGELALFLPEISSQFGVVSDLFLSAQQGDLAVTDLKMYYSQAIAGSASLLATIAQPPASLPIWFPAILQTVFNGGQQVGSIQLRGGQTTNISVAAIQASAPGDGRIFSSPIPLLRSDRSIGPGETLLLTGFANAGNLSTALYLQETSGVTTTVQTDFFDATGAPAGASRSDSLAGFRSLQLLSIVPAGAASVRVTDVSGGRLAACAVTSDNATSASWASIDTNRSSPAGTGVWVIPTLAPPAGSAQSDVFVTNASAAPVDFTLDTFSVNPPSRHRAVRPTDVSIPIAIGPLQTIDTRLTATTTLLRLAAPPGTISAAARMIVTTPGTNGSFGTSFPIVPLTNALRMSQGRRFTGIDDTQSGLRSSLLLAEVGGSTATVSVTLHYVFVAGQAVSSEAASTRTYTLTPGQMLVVPNLASDVIGPLRQSIGDLRNMQADVTVASGSGSVLPFVAETDSSSGNVMLRAE